MLRMLLHWFVSALAVWITSRVVPGFYVDGAAAALIAAIVIGLVNATLGLFLKVITFPLTILTLGLFWFVINAIMLELASAFVPGFHIRTFGGVRGWNRTDAGEHAAEVAGDAVAAWMKSKSLSSLRCLARLHRLPIIFCQ